LSRKDKEEKKLKLQMSQIPQDEPPLLQYPSNFPLSKFAKECIVVAQNKLINFGVLVSISETLISLESLKLAKEVIMIEGEFLYNITEINGIKLDLGINLIRDNLKNMM